MNSLMGFTEQSRLPLSPTLAQRSRSISTPFRSPPSDTLQFIMMIKLTSDLLSRLDCALVPLVCSVDKNSGYRLSMATEHRPLDLPTGPLLSSSSSSGSARCPSSEDPSDRKPAPGTGDVSTECDGTGHEVGRTKSASNILATRAEEQLQQQQSRLRTLIKVVKRLVRSQEV